MTARSTWLAVIFPVVLLAGRHWRALLAAAGGAIAVSAVGILVLRRATLDAWLSNLDLVRAGIDSGDLPVAKFVTPYTALRLLGLDQGVALAIHAAIAVVAVTESGSLTVMSATRSMTCVSTRSDTASAYGLCFDSRESKPLPEVVSAKQLCDSFG